MVSLMNESYCTLWKAVEHALSQYSSAEATCAHCQLDASRVNNNASFEAVPLAKGLPHKDYMCSLASKFEGPLKGNVRLAACGV